MWKFTIADNPYYDKEGTFEDLWAWMEYQVPSIVSPSSDHFLNKAVIEGNGSMTWNEPPYVVSIWDADRFSEPLPMSEGEIVTEDSGELLQRLIVEMTGMLNQMSDFLDKVTALFPPDPIVVDSVEDAEPEEETTVPPFVSGVPDVLPDPVGEMSDLPSSGLTIPDIEEMTAEEAIAAIRAFPNGADKATVLTLLLDAEEAGKRRKTVIHAIKEEGGFAQ